MTKDFIKTIYKDCPICNKHYRIPSLQDYVWKYPAYSTGRKYFCSFGCRKKYVDDLMAEKERKRAERKAARKEQTCQS